MLSARAACRATRLRGGAVRPRLARGAVAVSAAFSTKRSEEVRRRAAARSCGCCHGGGPAAGGRAAPHGGEGHAGCSLRFWPATGARARDALAPRGTRRPAANAACARVARCA